jgi:hypothetical protein
VAEEVLDVPTHILVTVPICADQRHAGKTVCVPRAGLKMLGCSESQQSELYVSADPDGGLFIMPQAKRDECHLWCIGMAGPIPRTPSYAMKMKSGAVALKGGTSVRQPPCLTQSLTRTRSSGTVVSVPGLFN